MKKVVITGASRGIGKATAEKFLREGWEVIGTSTSGRGWQHENLHWIQLNLSDSQSIHQAAKIISTRSPIDVLIDNAGYLADSEGDFSVQPIDIEILRKTLEVNVVGTIDFTEQLLKSVIPKGNIILIGSMCGSLTSKRTEGSPAYSISKTALEMYTRQLAEQNESTLTVSIIDPGWVKTDMGGPNATREPSEAAEEIYMLATSNVPTGRFWLNGKEREW